MINGFGVPFHLKVRRIAERPLYKYSQKDPTSKNERHPIWSNTAVEAKDPILMLISHIDPRITDLSW